MNKNIKWITVIVIAAAGVWAGYKFFFKRGTRVTAEVAVNTPLLAVYNRDSTQPVKDIKGSSHIVVRLTQTGSDDIGDKMQKVWPANNPVIVTVETWPDKASKPDTVNILTHLANGTLDDKINSLAAFINQQQQTVYVRFDPDMEVYVDTFPWQKQSSDMYVDAFRHFAAMVRKTAPNAKMVWAPAGYPGTDEYWPGALAVDMISVTLMGRSESKINHYPLAKNQQEMIYRKLHRLRFYDKPVLVLGSEKINKTNFEQTAFDAASNYLQQNKNIVYMDVNAPDKAVAPGPSRNDTSLITGIFDPTHSLVDSNNIALSAEHLFVNITALKGGSFKRKFDSVLLHNRNLIATLEPWKDPALMKDPRLMENILNGKYNGLFDQFYDIISHTNKTIYLRWLHEMEIPITRYPWQSQDPVAYIKAYRYFVNYIRNKKPTNIYFVWGPAGDRGSMEFWPGSDVVDYTSIAVYGLPDKNITDHNKQESFDNIFKRKYGRIWFSRKPVFITEFGVKGPAAYKAEWLTGAAATIEANKEIYGISYFNDVDNPLAWGDIEAPNWSVSPSLFRIFLKQLKTSVKQ